jgi:ABC-type antimicrobial peptide transport system permease subunit
MMKSYLSLAWKEIKTQKVTSVLILIAMVLSATATAALGQSVGILQFMRVNQAASLNGDRYASFHQLTEEQNEKLHSDGRLKDVGSIINLGSAEIQNSGLTLHLREYQGEALKAYPDVGAVEEGRLPQGKGEIALSGDTLKYLGLEARLGSAVTLPVSIALMRDDRLPYEYTADFVLTGILKNNYKGYVSGTLNAVVGEGTAKELLPERYLLYSADFKTTGTEQFQSIVDELALKLGVQKENIQYNWVLLNALGIDYAQKEGEGEDKGFPFMMAACIMVGVLILLAAGLVVYNILKVAVTKRIREYGTLRAIGSEKGQIYALVTVQLLILCGIGLPLGLVLGMLSAKGILAAAAGFLSPDIFLAESTQELNQAIADSDANLLPLVVSAAVTILFAVLAAFPSARYAARISPTEAMGGRSTKIRRRSRKQKKIRNFEAFYARLNLRRNLGRTVITVLSIVMSITVFVALQSFSALLDASSDVQKMYLGDYAVTNETSGMSPQAVSKLEALGLTADLAAAKLTHYMQDEEGNIPIDLDIDLNPSENFQIASVDEPRLSSYVPKLSKEDIEDLKKGTACLAVNPIPFTYQGEEIPHTELHQGETVTVNGVRLRIAGISEDPVCIGSGEFLNGVQVIVTDSLYAMLTGDDGYTEIYPTLKEDADAEIFEKWLDEWCAESPGTYWLSYRQADAQMAESFEQIRFLCWGLILFIGLIGVLNIVNTVYTNIHTRIREIGMQRAVGMSKRSLYMTFLWEGAYYGLLGAALGAVFGYICTVFIKAAVTDEIRLTAFPLLSVLEAAAVSVAACLTATAFPLRAIGKMSIVDSVETVE